ncbi:hypothetical protein LSAT2_030687, partial [Lamellibrachia satsuma]
VKHTPSQMIWGAMSCFGHSGLYFIPPNTTMNGPRYVELLKEKLKLHMGIHKCTIFMQDGNRPDLNPIENLWTIMKDKVADKQSSSAQNLKQAIKDIWVTEITREYCESLVYSMPPRIKAVIDSKGGHTKY